MSDTSTTFETMSTWSVVEELNDQMRDYLESETLAGFDEHEQVRYYALLASKNARCQRTSAQNRVIVVSNQRQIALHYSKRPPLASVQSPVPSVRSPLTQVT